LWCVLRRTLCDDDDEEVEEECHEEEEEEKGAEDDLDQVLAKLFRTCLDRSGSGSCWKLQAD
jgi:hypothetical protein